MTERGRTDCIMGEVDQSAAVIAELKAEVVALRREARMLRIANAELERVAIRDTLTPLYNRRYFLGALHERIVRARRYGTSSALLFIDKVRTEAKAEQLGRLLRGTECRYAEAVLPVSASIGWAMLMPDDTVDALIERADANMYARKRAWHRASGQAS